MEQQPMTVETALGMIRDGAEGSQLQAIVEWLRTQGGMPDFEPHHVHDQAALYAQAQAQAFAASATPGATPQENAPMDMSGFFTTTDGAQVSTTPFPAVGMPPTGTAQHDTGNPFNSQQAGPSNINQQQQSMVTIPWHVMMDLLRARDPRYRLHSSQLGEERQELRLMPRPSDIPEFSGRRQSDDVLLWLSKLGALWALYTGIDEETKKNIAVSRLGTAFGWWRTLGERQLEREQAANPSASVYDLFCKVLKMAHINKFSREQARNILDNLEQRPRQDVTRLIQVMNENLARVCDDYSDNHKKHIFRRALASRIRSALNPSDWDNCTFEEMCDKAVAMELNFRYETGQFSGGYTADNNGPQPMQLGNTNYRGRGRGRGSRGGRGSWAGRGRGGRSITSYNNTTAESGNGEAGSSFNNTRNEKSGNKTWDPKARFPCYECNEFGHFQNECPKKTARLEKERAQAGMKAISAAGRRDEPENEPKLKITKVATSPKEGAKPTYKEVATSSKPKHEPIRYKSQPHTNSTTSTSWARKDPDKMSNKEWREYRRERDSDSDLPTPRGTICDSDSSGN